MDLSWYLERNSFNAGSYVANMIPFSLREVVLFYVVTIYLTAYTFVIDNK